MSSIIAPAYDGEDFLKHMHLAAHIVRALPGREWFHRERSRYPMHPFVVKAIQMCRPDNWQDLMLQWPHLSTSNLNDATKLAYTRNERAGVDDKQTVTSLGKYLHANFSALPDHAIRDLVALATSAPANFAFVRTTKEMIDHLHRGPHSCMVWSGNDDDDDEDEDTGHPYEAYAPEYGWHMAVRVEHGATLGRALCMEEKDANGEVTAKYFVRSYKKSDGYSPADEQLEAWLKSQGYDKRGSWEGCKLKFVPASNNCGFLAPYIDGSAQHVTSHGSGKLIIVEEGEYVCNNTDGNADEADYESCEDCGARINDDGIWAGRFEDHLVCECCQESSYTHALSRNGNHRYIDNDYVVWVDGLEEYVDIDYLGDNDVVRTYDGDYRLEDDCVCIDGDWYEADDARVVRCVDGDEYHLRENVYYHKESGDWYVDEDAMPVDESEAESE